LKFMINVFFFFLGTQRSSLLPGKNKVQRHNTETARARRKKEKTPHPGTTHRTVIYPIPAGIVYDQCFNSQIWC
jgi:hypothetical protein